MSTETLAGKKGHGGGGLYENWPEVLSFSYIIIGFVIAAISKSAFMNYIIIFFSGMIFGRLWWQKRHKLKMPLFMMTIGYFAGFVLGSFYGSKHALIISFIIGFVVSQQLHEKKVIDW